MKPTIHRPFKATPVQALLAGWASRMTASHPEEHGAAFQHALRGDLAKQLDLAVLPMPAFPSTAQQLPDHGASSEVREVLLLPACLR